MTGTGGITRSAVSDGATLMVGPTSVVQAPPAVDEEMFAPPVAGLLIEKSLPESASALEVESRAASMAPAAASPRRRARRDGRSLISSSCVAVTFRYP
jgi:hypothetical protein